MDPATQIDLMSVAGITVAVGIVVQVARMVMTINRANTRRVAIAGGVALAVFAYLTTSDPIDAAGVVVAILNGMVAGLAAVAAADRIRAGPDYQVTDVRPGESAGGSG